MERPWLKSYPPGVPEEIDTHAYASVVDNGSNDPVYIAAQPLSDTSPFM